MRRKDPSQSSITTKPKTQSSGIFRLDTLPKILAYPQLYDFNELENNIRNIFCYVIKHYTNVGFSVLIYRQPKDDQVVVLCGDLAGNAIDLETDGLINNHARIFIGEELYKYLKIMQLIKVEQAQFFFSIVDGQIVLIDMQTAVNKMAGPGMIRDIFGNIVKTQEVLKIEVLDDRAIDAIKDGAGSYSGDLIIKPTRFRMYHDQTKNTYSPMYIEVIR